MNSTAERVGWVAEPTGRGTLGLLVSCATTIFLCTYSAVHPNVPGPEETGWVLLRKRITRVLGCITAPEYFVYGAIENYAYAQCLRKDVRIPQRRREGWLMIFDRILFRFPIQKINGAGSITFSQSWVVMLCKSAQWIEEYSSQLISYSSY